MSLTSDDVNAGVAHLKAGLYHADTKDMYVWELATNVPPLGNIWAYICFGLNVIIPGVGTMLAACLGDKHMNKTQLSIGFVQLLTSVYLIGWVSSIYWGYLIVKKSKGDHNEIKQLIANAQGTSEQQPR